MARKSTNMIGNLAAYSNPTLQGLLREQRRDMMKDRQRTLYEEPEEDEEDEDGEETEDVYEHMMRSMGNG